MVEISNVISDEFRQTYPCEFCHTKTYPSLVIAVAEKRDASVGAIMIRKSGVTNT